MKTTKRKEVRETVDVIVRVKVGYERGINAKQTAANRRTLLALLRDDMEISVEDIRHGVGPDEDAEHWFYVVKVMRKTRNSLGADS